MKYHRIDSSSDNEEDQHLLSDLSSPVSRSNHNSQSSQRSDQSLSDQTSFAQYDGSIYNHTCPFQNSKRWFLLSIVVILSVIFFLFQMTPTTASIAQIRSNFKANFFNDDIQTNWHVSMRQSSPPTRFKSYHQKNAKHRPEEEVKELDVVSRKKSQKEDEKHTSISTTEPQPALATENSATPKLDQYNENLPYILFYKTHKTGSSSVQNILMRLALKYKKAIMWSKDENTGIKYPIPFTPALVRNPLHTAEILCNHMRPTRQIFDMFPEEIKEHPEKLFQFTVLREPLGLMKSTYNYYESTGVAHCISMSKTLKDYLDNFDQRSKIPYKQPFCKNSNSFDLGYETEVFAKSEIDNIVSELDKKLNLVLILEHYWESMILLKDALKISLTDVVSFKLNRAVSRPNKIGIKKEDEDKYRQIVRQKVKLDTEIYDHFYEKFMAKVADYGVEKMASEVEILKKLTNEKFQACGVYEVIPASPYGSFTSAQKVPANKIPWHPPNVAITSLLLNLTETQKSENSEFYKDCLVMTLPELKMGNFVRNKQIKQGLVPRLKTDQRYRHRRSAESKAEYKRLQEYQRILRQYEMGLFTPEVWPAELQIPV